MSYSCKILLDSISETGKRLTTFEIAFPRCVLAEAETHRVFRGWGGNIEELVIHNLGINVDENLSRNSASSRAIPINKMLEAVEIDPFIPEKFGKPVKGMGAKEYWPIDSPEHKKLTAFWEDQLSRVRIVVRSLSNIANKEDLNRLLEPFMYHTAIITATEFDNFFKLRTNSAADWKIRKIADLMYEAYHAFDDLEFSNHAGFSDNGVSWSAIRPQKLKVGEWHCPLVYEEDRGLVEEKSFTLSNEECKLYNGHLDYIQQTLKKISVARCARVSYLTHDGKRDIEKDLELFERLRTSGHWSPFEHCATPFYSDINDNKNIDPTEFKFGWQRVKEKPNYFDIRSGNFIGWKQYRKEFADENCTNFRKEN